MKSHTDLDDFLILVSIDSSCEDDDVDNDETDVFNVSCHGNDLKKMIEEPRECNEFTIKRRKIHTQLDLLNASLLSFGIDKGVQKERSDGENTPPRKRRRKLPTKGCVKINPGTQSIGKKIKSSGIETN